MFKDNLIQLRKLRKLTQEEVAEKVGVTRQTVAKWEAGDTVPDLDKCRLLAETLSVSLITIRPLCKAQRGRIHRYRDISFDQYLSPL